MPHVLAALQVLGTHDPTEPHTFGWVLGYVITTAVIVVVVALVGKILALAHNIGKQARVINQPLVEARSHTAPLPQLQETINHAEVIVDGLYRSRKTLGG